MLGGGGMSVERAKQARKVSGGVWGGGDEEWPKLSWVPRNMRLYLAPFTSVRDAPAPTILVPMFSLDYG